MDFSDKRILIVEDEPKLAGVLEEYLQQSSFKTHRLDNGLAVIPWVKSNPVDLIVLDLMLPGKGGIDIFRELNTFTQLPVIMATARVDEIDRLLGLELGADDYVCKPYSPRELVARVKNIIRRASYSVAEKQAKMTSIEMDENKMEVRLNHRFLDLTPVEYRMLKFFLDHPERIFSRTQLLDHIHDDYRAITDRAVDSHIKNLRQKLREAMPDQEFIKSIYGIGYKFEPLG